MERDDWTDRDGYRWYVRGTSPGGAMATAGQIPDAGKNVIRFQRHNSSESYTVETLYFRDPNKISNEDLQQLLDQAKAEELEG